MLTDEQIRALRDGCEGVTPGPWAWWGPRGTEVGGLDGELNGSPAMICHFGDSEQYYPTEGDPPLTKDREHIARCDPQTIGELCTRVLSAEARVKVLEDALRWYGEQARLAKLIHAEGDLGRHRLAKDGGDRARKALEAGK